MRYLLIIFLLISCNPVKQVLNNPEKFNEVAEEVVRRGYCVNDTVTITETKDSVVYKDSVVEKIKNVPCRDFDTTIGRAKITVKNGVLSYLYKDSIVFRTRVVTNNIRDTKYESILKTDIDSAVAKLGRIKEEFDSYKVVSHDTIKGLKKDKLDLWLIIVALSIFIFRRPILKIIKGFI